MSAFRVLMFARYLPPEYSGAASQALLLAHYLRERGHEVELVTPAWKGIPTSYRIDGFQVTTIHINLKAVHQELSVWRSLAAYLWQRRDRVDILHGQGAYYTQSIVGPLGRLFGKPSLVKASLYRDDLSSLEGSSIAPVHRRFLAMIDAYVAISRDLEQELLAKGLRGDKIRRIPNGVDTARFRPATPGERRAAALALGLPPERQIALYVGVLDERKRIAWLAERWVATAGFGSGALLLAVGPTSREPYGRELRERLDALAAAHPDLLRVHGHAQDVLPYYWASHWFVFPSSNEGLPNALLEAMACGLPAVATRVSGCRELVLDGETGASFAVDDAEGLARALAGVRGEAAPHMAERARALVQDAYAIESIAARYEDLYEHLSEQVARSRRAAQPGTRRV